MSYHILLTVVFSVYLVQGHSQVQINNLIHSENYKTGTWGELGDVKKSGSGTQEVILLPGWGFDHSIFKGFIQKHEKDFKMFTITISGFGNTQAPPMPEGNENYSSLHWTKGLIQGIADLIDKEKMNKPILISCFTYSNVIAMRMALDFPDKIKKVIIISGMAKFTANYPSFEPRTLKDRVFYIDNILSKRWFKTVTKETWDYGNFHPGTFTQDTVKAAKYWEMMSAVPIPVMVRYLCEYYCTDLSLEYGNLKVPTLILVPAFTTDFLSDPKHSYITPFFHASWLGALPASKNIHVVTLQDTHAFIMEDQPDKLDEVINEFLNDKLKPFAPIR